MVFINLETIKKSPLFAGIDEDKLELLLNCLAAKRKTYVRNEYIFSAGSKAAYVGIVLSGGVHVVQDDFWGNRGILSHLGSGEMFGEAFSCAEADTLPVSVIAADKTEVMLIDYRKIVTVCPSACSFHTRLIMNMLRILAEKNIMLTRKMEHISKRTTREKLLSFLSACAVNTKSGILEIPFNRQELADYLCVDRSSLSREMGLMQKEGILRYDRNSFELLS